MGPLSAAPSDEHGHRVTMDVNNKRIVEDRRKGTVYVGSGTKLHHQ